MTAIHTLQTDCTIQPGQRFAVTDIHTPLATSELVVDRVVRDGLGMLHVVLRDLDGREISTFAEQVEAAINAGLLVAVEDAAFASA